MSLLPRVGMVLLVAGCNGSVGSSKGGLVAVQSAPTPPEDGGRADAAAPEDAGQPNPSCHTGACPILLAASSGGDQIAIDAENVYWADWNQGARIRKIPLTGGAPVVLASPSQTQPSTGLAVDSADAYWVLRDGTVAKTPTHGGATTTLVPAGQDAGSERNAVNLAVDGTTVYWTEQRSGWDGVVLSVPIAGGPVTTVASDQQQPAGLAVSEGYVYWTTLDGNVVKARGVPPGPPRILASHRNGPTALCVRNRTLYWADYGTGKRADGALLKMSVDGGGPTVLATAQQNPYGLAVDDAFLYWRRMPASAVGDVMKVALGGGSPIAIATRQVYPTAIAVDARSLYWTNQGLPAGGGVFKLSPK